MGREAARAIRLSRKALPMTVRKLPILTRRPRGSRLSEESCVSEEQTLLVFLSCSTNMQVQPWMSEHSGSGPWSVGGLQMTHSHSIHSSTKEVIEFDLHISDRVSEAGNVGHSSMRWQLYCGEVQQKDTFAA